MSTHRCPGPGCKLQVADDELACPHHWSQVSQPVRDEVSAAWQAKRRAQAAASVHDMDLQPALVDAEQRHDLAMHAAIAEMTA